MRGLFSFLFLLPLALVTTPIRGEECGSKLTDDQMRIALQSDANRTATGYDPSRKRPKPPKYRPIDVYWHIIYKDKTLAGGYTPRRHVKDSIKALNKAYESAGYAFKLKRIDRRKNVKWWESEYGSEGQREMKEKLHKGDEHDLNVWTSSIPGLRGYATFPYEYDDEPKLDGVVVEPSTLVGGTSIGYNLGVTFIHEVGHWAGLYHTFQGGCSEPGDSVADTPQSASPSSSCDVNRDSCPGNPGKDPVTNYMDYSPHTCKNNFTPGQIARMHEHMKMYRDLEPKA